MARPEEKRWFQTNAILSFFALISIVSLLLAVAPLMVEDRPIKSSLSNGWDLFKLRQVSQQTLSFRNGDSHEVLQSCYDPNATLATPLSPSGIEHGASAIAHQAVATRSFGGDAAFFVNSLGISTHTVNKDTNAITAAVGHYVHTGVNATGGRQCEVENPMHIFQEIDENYTVVNEWQHVNYDIFLRNLKQCNTLNLPVGARVASEVISKVFPDVINYGWNGSKLIDLANRFWSDMNDNLNAVQESVTVDMRSLVEDLAQTMQEAGLKTSAIAPNTPSLVINAKSKEWATLSVVVAQEVVGIDVQTGGSCSFRLQWVHAYIIQRHYRIAGFVTAGNSNEFEAKMIRCNKFGTKSYGYRNSKQRQSAAQAVMDNLGKNRFLEHVLSGDIRVKVVNTTLDVSGKTSN